MASRAHRAVVHSTMYQAMNADALPKFEVMMAIVTGCGGSQEDLAAFATAWRQIESGRVQRAAARTKVRVAAGLHSRHGTADVRGPGVSAVADLGHPLANDLAVYRDPGSDVAVPVAETLILDNLAIV
jgi:hypothetical protein